VVPIRRRRSILRLIHICLGLSGNIFDLLPRLLHDRLYLPPKQDTAFDGFAQEWAGDIANSRGHSFQHGR
jgi:hypothetical protein